jgi:hypothetical protein
LCRIGIEVIGKRVKRRRYFLRWRRLGIRPSALRREALQALMYRREVRLFRCRRDTTAHRI